MTDVLAQVSTDFLTPYSWGEGCSGWHMVRTDAMSVIEERMPPTTSEVRHRHLRARQFFYVLHGTVTIECDGIVQVLASRSGLEVPPGVAHQVRNEGDMVAAFLVMSVPPAQGDRENVEVAVAEMPVGS